MPQLLVPTSADIVPLWTATAVKDPPKSAFHMNFLAFAFRLLGIEPDEIDQHKMFVILPWYLYSDKSLAAATGSLCFRSGVASVHLASDGPCTVIGSGLPSAMVLNVGYSSSSCMAVKEGYALGSSIVSTAVGGKYVNEKLKEKVPSLSYGKSFAASLDVGGAAPTSDSSPQSS